MKKILHSSLILLTLLCFNFGLVSAQNGIYNKDSIRAVSSTLFIKIECGKVIIERYDSLGIQLAFLPSVPNSQKISSNPGDTGEYVWFMTSETNDPIVRSDGDSSTDPNRKPEPGSFENEYTIGMANYKKSHPGYSIIGFEEDERPNSVPANSFLPYWHGFVSIYRKVNGKYVIQKRFKYGWEYTGHTENSKQYNSFEYSPPVSETKEAYDYHFMAGARYPEVLHSKPAPNANK